AEAHIGHGQVVGTGGKRVEAEGPVAVGAGGGLHHGRIDQRVGRALAGKQLPYVAPAAVRGAVAHGHIGAIRGGEGVPRVGEGVLVNQGAGLRVSREGGVGVVTGEGERAAYGQVFRGDIRAQVVGGRQVAADSSGNRNGIGTAALAEAHIGHRQVVGRCGQRVEAEGPVAVDAGGGVRCFRADQRIGRALAGKQLPYVAPAAVRGAVANGLIGAIRGGEG